MECRGCITPKVFSNVKRFVGDDGWDLIDGLDELPEDWQTAFRQAVEVGHVPDEDWAGVRLSLNFITQFY